MTPAFGPLSEGSAAAVVTGREDLLIDVPVVDLGVDVPHEGDLPDSERVTE